MFLRWIFGDANAPKEEGRLPPASRHNLLALKTKRMCISGDFNERSTWTTRKNCRPLLGDPRNARPLLDLLVPDSEGLHPEAVLARGQQAALPHYPIPLRWIRFWKISPESLYRADEAYAHCGRHPLELRRSRWSNCSGDRVREGSPDNPRLQPYHVCSRSGSPALPIFKNGRI